MADKTPYLHVYAQGAWHDDAHIVGTRDALTALREAIEGVLIDDCPGEVPVSGLFCADGEGFTLRVALADEADMQDYAVPYTKDIAMERDGDPAAWPRKKRR